MLVLQALVLRVRVLRRAPYRLQVPVLRVLGSQVPYPQA